MDIDGLVKLSDAEIRRASAQGDMATTMADVATKVAQIGVINEEALRKRLENIAKFLEIQWDKQAHDHLIRMRKLKLQKAEQLQSEAKYVRKATVQIGQLLVGGGSLTEIVEGWAGFDYFRGHTPPGASIKLGSIAVEDSAYSTNAWMHPTKSVQELPMERRDMGHLWAWAHEHNYYPKSGQAAWKALAEYVQIISEAAAAIATEVNARLEKAQTDALELQRLDWERLKKPKSEG